MKNIIVKEAKNAIPEADHEPTASLFEPNQLQSIILQNEKESMYIGSDHVQSFLENNRDTFKVDKSHSKSLKVVIVKDVQEIINEED